jgi:hypothetical protein
LTTAFAFSSFFVHALTAVVLPVALATVRAPAAAGARLLALWPGFAVRVCFSLIGGGGGGRARRGKDRLLLALVR